VDQEDAKPGDSEKPARMFAETGEPESLEDSFKTEEDALSGKELVPNTLDAEERASEEESSESGTDPVKFASNTEEETTSGLDAAGLEAGEEPEP